MGILVKLFYPFLDLPKDERSSLSQLFALAWSEITAMSRAFDQYMRIRGISAVSNAQQTPRIFRTICEHYVDDERNSAE